MSISLFAGQLGEDDEALRVGATDLIPDAVAGDETKRLALILSVDIFDGKVLQRITL